MDYSIQTISLFFISIEFNRLSMSLELLVARNERSNLKARITLKKKKTKVQILDLMTLTIETWPTMTDGSRRC